MKQKILAFLLALLLVVGLASSISPAVFAAEERASETEQQRRQKVVDYMYNMCTVAWTPSQTINSAGCSCPHDYTFEAGTTYYGLPYTHKCGSLERMESYIGANNVIDTSKFPAVGYNGWDYLLGNDCADAVFWSWYQISNDISFTFTDNMLSDPAIKPVGNYAFIKNDIFTTATSLTMKEMMEIYAQVQMGDCMLKPGHARLAASNAVVVRNADGSINPQQSYILIHEQGGQTREYFNTKHSTCGVNKKETFYDLWVKNHLAVTIDAFANGDAAGTATMRQGATSQGGLPMGTISSTGRINFVTLEIYNADGSVAKTNTVYPCNGGHNDTYTIDANALYYDNDDEKRLTLGSNQTVKLFVSDHSGRIEVTINEAPPHTNHCVCGGDGVGMEGHASCSDATWKVFKQSAKMRGYFYLTSDVYISGSAMDFSNDVYICLNGFRMYTVNSRLFYSKTEDEDYKLSICDCSAEKTGTVENTSPGYKDDNGNYVRIQSGSILSTGGSSTRVHITLWGGNFKYSGVPNRNGGGLFHLYGGSSLTVYKANLSGGKSNPETSDGGLIYAAGDCKVTIYGGTFSGGSARHGGLIRAAGTDTVLTIKGGTFTNGEAKEYGGLISANGTTNISGGTFTSGSAKFGGLLHLGGKTNITGGYFASGVATQDGGNIYNTGDESTLKIANAVITAGSAVTNGGGVYMDNGVLTVSGTTKIADNLVGEKANNVYLKSGKKVVIDGGLTDGASIGITLESTTGTVAEWANASQTKYFTSDNANYGICYNTAIVVGQHSYKTEWSKDATNHWHECACGAKADVAAHSFSAWAQTKAPTCTEKGEETRTCACGAKETRDVAATGHSYSTEWSKDATNHWHECACGDKADVAAHTPGAAATETTAQTCTACNYVIQPALNHVHAFESTFTYDKTSHWHACPGCNEKEGEAEHIFDNDCDTKCDTCGYTRTITHNYKTEWSKDETNHWHECACGDKIDVEAHSFGEWTESKAPTCTEKGEETRTCVCGAKETREVAAKGHSFGEWTESKAPTCTEKGEETRTCACGEKETREVAAKGHSFGEWTESKAPTCTEKGEETRTCACGEKETREVDMIDHAMTEKGHDETHHWAVCKVCQHTGTKEAHAYGTTGFCACGAKNPDADPVPPTGDNTSLVALTAMAMMSLFALAAVVVTKRKIAN